MHYVVVYDKRGRALATLDVEERFRDAPVDTLTTEGLVGVAAMIRELMPNADYILDTETGCFAPCKAPARLKGRSTEAGRKVAPQA